MKQSTFTNILETALTWDAIGDESMAYPTFETEEELSLFENFLILLNDFETLDRIGFISYRKQLDGEEHGLTDD